MSTQPKPTWRHATRNSADYMVCTVADSQKKLPFFKPSKWMLNAQCKIAQCGHDAENMKNFTLHFETDDQCESLDQLWFGKVWFRIKKYACEAQSIQSPDCILDPAELDLEPGQDEPELCFLRSQVQEPAYALLDRGATHVLLPGHMLPKGARSFEVTVISCSWTRTCAMLEKRRRRTRQSPSIVTTWTIRETPRHKVCVENGQAFTQCRDKAQWKTMTKFEARNNMAYVSQMQFEVLHRALWAQRAQPQTVFDWKVWEKAAHDPKMTRYLNQGVKAKTRETIPYVNTVGTQHFAARAKIELALECDYSASGPVTQGLKALKNSKKRFFGPPEMKPKVLKKQHELTVTVPALRHFSMVFWGGPGPKDAFRFQAEVSQMNGIVGHPREDDSVGVRQCLATVGMLTRAAVGYGSCLALRRWIYARGSFFVFGKLWLEGNGNCSSRAGACVCVCVSA